MHIIMGSTCFGPYLVVLKCIDVINRTILLNSLFHECLKTSRVIKLLLTKKYRYFTCILHIINVLNVAIRWQRKRGKERENKSYVEDVSKK